MLPNELVLAVERARAALYRDHNGDLLLGYRLAIFAAFAHETGANRVNHKSGWIRRVHLAILATEQVLPLWDRSYPTERVPYILLEATRRLLDDSSLKGGYSFYGECQVEIENITYRTENEDTACYAGWCALRAFGTALTFETIDPESIDYAITDKEWEIQQADPSYFACCAAASGPVWDENSDIAKRRSFWLWWLDEAVPTAYHNVPDTPNQDFIVGL